jgi:hypothetical protein
VPVFRKPCRIDLERMPDFAIRINFRHLLEKYGLNAVLFAWAALCIFAMLENMYMRFIKLC